MLSPHLRAYLAIERVMLSYPDADPIRDVLCDALDPIWYQLKREDIAYLDNRVIDWSKI